MALMVLDSQEDFVQTLKVTLLVIFLLAVQSQARGQNADGTDGMILMDRHYSFILKEPAEWVMDSEAAKSQGLQSVFYRAGSSWKTGVAVMYVRVVYKNETQPTLDKVIGNDVSDFLKQSRDSKVSDSTTLTTRDKKQAIVKDFYDGANKNHESVAFIDEPKVVVIVALSSRNRDEFDKSLPAFKALVGSYFFLAAMVDR
jgi:hypothetical protein